VPKSGFVEPMECLPALLAAVAKQISGEEPRESSFRPLSAFVLNASVNTVQESVGRQQTDIVNALRTAHEPAFSSIIREAFSTFAFEAMSSIAHPQRNCINPNRESLIRCLHPIYGCGVRAE
jgi:hypothetical protein